MLITLRRSLIALAVLASSLFLAPKAFAALTIGPTSIASDSNLVLQPASNVGIGNSNPQALLHLGTAGSRAGVMKLDGATSGTVTIQPASVAGTWTFTLPNSAGTNGQVLTTNGSGATSWTTVAGGGGVTNSAGANVIPKSDGTNLVASRITDLSGDGITLDTAGSNERILLSATGYASNTPGSVLLTLNESNYSAALEAANGSIGLGDPEEVGGRTRIIIDDAVNGSINLAAAGFINAQTTGTFCAGDCDGNGSNKKFIFNDASSRLVIGADGGSTADGIEVKFVSALSLPVVSIGSALSGNGTLITVDDDNQQITLYANNSIDLNANSVKLDSAGQRPACSSNGDRSALFFTFGGSGSPDKIEVCMKKSDNTFGWVAVVTAP